jgi:hypothetical protein
MCWEKPQPLECGVCSPKKLLHHIAVVNCKFDAALCFGVLTHHSYSPNLSPCSFFVPVKYPLQEFQSESANAVKSIVAVSLYA